MEEQKKLRKRKKIQRPKELVYSAKVRITEALEATAAATGMATLQMQRLWK